MATIFNLELSVLISFSAILMIVFCLMQVFTLKAKVPGGVIGKQWNVLVLLVLLFSIGYLATPFFGALPPEMMRLIASIIFFFGAVYVWITIRLIYRVIQELTA